MFSLFCQPGVGGKLPVRGKHPSRDTMFTFISDVPIFRSRLVWGAALAASLVVGPVDTNAQTEPTPPSSTPQQQQQLPTEQQPQQVPPATAPQSPPDAAQSPSPEAQPADTQQPDADQSNVFVFRKEVEEVVLHATVVDDQRRLVTNVGKEGFAVYENGIPQTITSFRREDVPVALGVLVDNSGSMRDKRERVNQAVLNLVRVSNPMDEIFVVNFSRGAYLDQDFTSDIGLLHTALQKVSTQGTTALYDAIVASAAHLEANPRLAKRVLLVITDGQDNASRETLTEAARRLGHENGPLLYAIGLVDQDFGHPNPIPLSTLASANGGVAFFPHSVAEVDAMTMAIAHDIRSQYSIGYKSSNAALTGYRSIRVEARAPGYRTLTVRTRKGYYPGETPH
jgi:VWFA-related protein